MIQCSFWMKRRYIFWIDLRDFYFQILNWNAMLILYLIHSNSFAFPYFFSPGSSLFRLDTCYMCVKENKLVVCIILTQPENRRTVFIYAKTCTRIWNAKSQRKRVRKFFWMKGEKNVAGKQRPQLATRPADTGGAPVVEPTYVEHSGRRSPGARPVHVGVGGRFPGGLESRTGTDRRPLGRCRGDTLLTGYVQTQSRKETGVHLFY